MRKYFIGWMAFITIWVGAAPNMADSMDRPEAGANGDAEVGALPDSSSAGNLRIAEAYRSRPLSFEVNHGQVHPSAHLVSRGEGYQLFLTRSEAVLALHASSEGVLRIQFVGAASDPEISGQEALPGKVNYFKGEDPREWHTRIPTYAEVRYREIYPGIDLVFHGDQNQLEYDFILSPGGDPKAIRLAFKGVDSMVADDEGNLVLHMPGGRVIQKAPSVYQESDGKREEIPSRYEILGKGEVGFHVGAYDLRRPLIIDPVIVYSTYLGGSGADTGRAVAVDAESNVYVTGWTNAPDFFPDDGSGSFNGDETDVFVAKFNAAGTDLIYIAYLGGTDFDYGRGIAADAEGNAYVTGWTGSTDFPIVNPYQFNPSEDTEVFVSRLSADGSALLSSTYLGGNNNDQAYDITLDAAGNVYITGFTDSTDFPLVNPYQARLNGDDDVFIAMFNAEGSRLLYSTYLGGSERDYGRGVAVNGAGHIYITGYTLSDDYPLLNPFQAGRAGDEDAFVTVLNPASGGAEALLFSTYLGGSDNDEGRDIVVDASGSAYIVGETLSTDYPVINPYQADHRGQEDVFVTQLNPVTGGPGAVLYSTYLGGSDNEEGHGIALDGAGNIYITGETESDNFPVRDPVQQEHGGGRDDAFVCMLNPLRAGPATLIYATYLGGEDDDKGYGIAADGAGNIYVTGETRSDDFPVRNGFEDEYAGDGDIFVVKLSPTEAPPVPTVGGAAAGPVVETSIDTGETGSFILLLSRQAIEGSGRLYVSIEVPSVPEWADLMWFRPSDVRTPPALQLVRTEMGFLPDAENDFFFEGPLSPTAPDLQFIVGGLEGLAGETLVFTIWYLEEGIPFGPDNLRPIQIVRVLFQ